VARDQSTSQLRTVLDISKASDGGWQATVFSIDVGTEGMNATSATLQG
jgi:hypothetical protein